MTLDDVTVKYAVEVGATVTFTCGSSNSASEWFHEGASAHNSGDATYTFAYSAGNAGVYSCKNGNSDVSNSITLATGMMSF